MLHLLWRSSESDPIKGGSVKTMIRLMALVAGLLASQLCIAQAPAGAPAGATGLCNDGTYYTGATKQGACRGHKGVKNWYGESATNPPAAAKGSTTEKPATAATAPAANPPAAATTSTQPSVKATSKTTTAAAGGGPGQVWLNTSTNVYHCPGTQYYGKTKAGAYMTEADAKAKGAHPDHGKACN